MNPETVIAKSAELLNTASSAATETIAKSADLLNTASSVASEVIVKSADLMSSVISETATAMPPIIVNNIITTDFYTVLYAAVAAIIGAVAGAIVTGRKYSKIESEKLAHAELIEETARKALKKALKMGLYFEICSNRIVERDPNEDGTPDLTLSTFYDSFYQQNKTDITRLFDAQLLTKLSTLYLKFSEATSSQEEKRILTAKHETYEKTSFYTPSKRTLLVEHIQLLNLGIQGALCTALGLQHFLSSEFRNSFTIDPGEVEMHFPEKYETWLLDSNKRIEQELKK